MFSVPRDLLLIQVKCTQTWLQAGVWWREHPSSRNHSLKFTTYILFFGTLYFSGQWHHHFQWKQLCDCQLEVSWVVWDLTMELLFLMALKLY
jgi:hypothetical protein